MDDAITISPLLSAALMATAWLVMSWLLGRFVCLMAGSSRFGTTGYIALGAIGSALGGFFLGSYGDGFLTRVTVCVLGPFGALWAYNGLKDCFLSTRSDA